VLNQAESGVTHSCKLENFSGKVLEYSCDINGSLGSNAHLVLGVVLQESLDTTAGKLEKRFVSKCRVKKCAIGEPSNEALEALLVSEIFVSRGRSRIC
jgi:hypothetical protein